MQISIYQKNPCWQQRNFSNLVPRRLLSQWQCPRINEVSATESSRAQKLSILHQHITVTADVFFYPTCHEMSDLWWIQPSHHNLWLSNWVKTACVIAADCDSLSEFDISFLRRKFVSHHPIYFDKNFPTFIS